MTQRLKKAKNMGITGINGRIILKLEGHNMANGGDFVITVTNFWA
jgi:hypothetical protein